MRKCQQRRNDLILVGKRGSPSARCTACNERDISDVGSNRSCRSRSTGESSWFLVLRGGEFSASGYIFGDGAAAGLCKKGNK